MEKSTINYHAIYADILENKFPQKKEECRNLLEKRNLSSMDVIELNKKIFGISNKKIESENQKHRSYDKSDILKILDYQKKNRLNNSQLARHFKLSRNTVAKWKLVFEVTADDY